MESIPLVFSGTSTGMTISGDITEAPAASVAHAGSAIKIVKLRRFDPAAEVPSPSFAKSDGDVPGARLQQGCPSHSTHARKPSRTVTTIATENTSEREVHIRRRSDFRLDVVRARGLVDDRAHDLIFLSKLRWAALVMALKAGCNTRCQGQQHRQAGCPENDRER